MTDDQYQQLRTKFIANDLTRLETQAVFDECDRLLSENRELRRIRGNGDYDAEWRSRQAEMGGRV